MLTVLTVEPLDFGVGNRMAKLLRGFATRPGHRHTPIDYPATLSRSSIPKGVDALAQQIADVPGDKVVLAHSQGAQVASEWLRAHAGAPGAPPPARLWFILTGNPQRRIGGRARRSVTGDRLLPTPDDTQYRVFDLARRWDGWANWDNYPDGPSRRARARLILGMTADHTDYTDVGVDDPANRVRAVVGNTVYIITP